MKKNLVPRYEFGALFSYKELYKELLKLVTIIPSKRIGLNGIYFQKNLNENPVDLLKFNKLKKKNNSQNLIINTPSKIINKFSSLKKINLKKNVFSKTFQRNDSDIISFPFIKYENKYFSPKKQIRKNLFLFKSKSAVSIISRNDKTINKSNLESLNNKSKYFQKFFYDEKEYLKRLEKSKLKKQERKSLSLSNFKEMDLNKKTVLGNFFHKLSKRDLKFLLRKNQ